MARVTQGFVEGINNAIRTLIRRAYGVQDSVNGLVGKHIALLGLAYKPDVDDLRESPAIAVGQRLAAEGVTVSAYEPFKPEAKVPGIQLFPDLEGALQDADHRRS